VSVHDGVPPVAGTDPSPSRIAIGRETLDAIRGRLTDEERQLADLRSQGCEWAEIARELGGNPQARRKLLSRAVNRAARALGLDEDEDGDHLLVPELLPIASRFPSRDKRTETNITGRIGRGVSGLRPGSIATRIRTLSP
jgi:hypothetical protein